MTDAGTVAAQCYEIARDIARRNAEILKHFGPGHILHVRREELEFLVQTVLDLTSSGREP